MCDILDSDVFRSLDCVVFGVSGSVKDGLVSTTASESAGRVGEVVMVEVVVVVEVMEALRYTTLQGGRPPSQRYWRADGSRSK